MHRDKNRVVAGRAIREDGQRGGVRRERVKEDKDCYRARMRVGKGRSS